MRSFTAIVCWLLAMAWATSAAAEDIAFARTPGDERIAGRLNAELGALGLVVRQVVLERDEPKTLKQIGVETHAIAALRASPSKTGIELWVKNPHTGDTAFEEVVTLDSGRNDELLAIRTVEVLRARLLKLGVTAEASELEPPRQPDPPPKPEPPAKPKPEPAPPAPPTPVLETEPAQHSEAGRTAHTLLAVDVHAAYGQHLDRLGGGAMAGLGLTLAPTARWSLSALALLPMRPLEVENSLGRARVKNTLLGGGLDLVLVPGPLAITAGLGGLLAVIGIEADAAPPYSGRKQRLLTGLPFARTELALRLSDNLTLRLGLMAGVSIPPTVIRFDDEEVTHWGRPLILGTLGLRAGVPGTEL